MRQYNQEKNDNPISQNDTTTSPLVCNDPNVPYGWRYKLAIEDKNIKQTKLFKILVAEQNDRDNLPTIRLD